MHVSRKRLLLSAGGITAVGAAATLVLGATLGLFTGSQTSNSLAFTAGTVTVGTPVTSSCTIGPLVPLDSSNHWPGNPITGQTDTQGTQCTFSVNYVGTVPAFVGVYATVTGTNLYDGTANGLQLAIADGGSHSYTTSGAIHTNSQSDPMYVATDSAGTTSHSFTVDWFLPNSATANSYQGLTSTITLTVEAVQTGNNAGTCATVGSQCGTNPSWG